MPSSTGDPSLLSAHRLSAEISAGRLSPVAAVEAFLARIASQNQQLHAYIDVYADTAKLAADRARWPGGVTR